MQKKVTKRTENLSPDRVAFAQRLAACVEKVGSVAVLGRRSGIAAPTIADYLSGSDPSRERVIALAKASDVSFLWLATGEGPQQAGLNEPSHAFKYAPVQNAPATIPQENTGFCNIPVMSVVASAGDGAAVMKEEIAEHMSLSRSLVQKLGLNPDDAFVVYARGESMEPVIKGGELLICSAAERHLMAGDGIYLLRLEGDILVKHVQRLPKSRLRIFSENPRYEAFEVAMNDSVDFAILGKVLHVMRQV